MNPPGLPHRDNLIERRVEPWRPPKFEPQTTRSAEITAGLRRFFDLQASSIWHDLKSLLAKCEGSVLDVGCGAQPYRALLPAGVHYVGIDTSDARSRFGYDQVPDTIYFKEGTWPIASHSIDTVIATETLEHVAQPQQFLAEARRVLKPEGWLVLTVPFAARWHYIQHDYWRFTPSGLQTTLTEAGFNVPVVYARGNEVTVACYKLLTLLFMLLLGEFRHAWLRFAARLAGCFLLPLMVCLALIGQWSLGSRGGNDCLGYTAVASLAKFPLEASKLTENQSL